MDKLKKRIFIILLLLLAAGLAGLGILLAQLHSSQTQKTASSVTVQDENPEKSPSKQAGTEPLPDTAQNADSGTAHLSQAELSRLEMEEWAVTLSPAKERRQQDPPRRETAPAQPADSKSAQANEELTRLETEELKPFLRDELLPLVLVLNQNPFTRASAYVTGIKYFNQQCARQEISQEELENKTRAYKQTLDNMWQRRQQYAAHWTDMPCEKAILPPDSPKNLLCRLGDTGFCAFYENGRPYFCHTKNAQTRYQLNPWGSSITVTHKTPLGQPRLELYYADGKLTRTTDYDGKNNLITKTWFDGKNSFRLTQTDNNGRVLDKYYFTPGKPYMRYPDGNDLAATEGPWELKDGQIFTDGQPFYTLPEQMPVPDVCRIFGGACPSPAELSKRTTPGTLIPPNNR